jgi:thymidylate synthase (FAD)
MESHFIDGALDKMLGHIASTHLECYPEGIILHKFAKDYLFPHGGWERERRITDNELIVELAGRLCYYSFGAKAGTPTNKGYIAHTQQGAIPHRSLMYHPKMTFFLSGISRRLTHELIRHYVGADRSEEGSPSQESTRYVEHPGWFVVPPYVLAYEDEVAYFEGNMGHAYAGYMEFITVRERVYAGEHDGKEPKGLDRKRIYEAASSYLPHSAMTSMVWTTNPAALGKLFMERLDESADLEFQRLAQVWKGLCVERWPNLFQEYAK